MYLFVTNNFARNKLNADVSRRHSPCSTTYIYMYWFLRLGATTLAGGASPMTDGGVMIFADPIAKPYACPQEQFQTFRMSRAGVCQK
jgi:hypothetical protein